MFKTEIEHKYLDTFKIILLFQIVLKLNRLATFPYKFDHLVQFCNIPTTTLTCFRFLKKTFENLRSKETTFEYAMVVHTYQI